MMQQDGERVAEDRVLLARTRTAIARLPEEQRVVLALVAVEGVPYREAAAIVGVPVGTVMSRLARARAKLHAFVYGTAVAGEVA